MHFKHRGEAQLYITCDTTKIALQASRQARKVEPQSPNKTEKFSMKPQFKTLKMLPEMMIDLLKTPPKNIRRLSIEIQKSYQAKIKIKIIIKKNFELFCSF